MQIKTLKLFVAATALFSLSACNNDENLTDPFADGPVAMTFTADINSVATRAQGENFEERDVVGIIPVKDGSVENAQANLAYTYSDRKFNATLPYYFQDMEEVTFNAYYPQDNIIPQHNYVIKIETSAQNQKVEAINENNWRKNDYLFAKATTTVGTPIISFIKEKAFKHVMSQLTLTFEVGNGIDNLELLKGYTLNTLALEGTFDLATGDIALAKEDEPSEVIKKENLEITVNVPKQEPSVTTHVCDPLILLPQIIDDKKIALNVAYNGQTYKTNLNLPDGHDRLKAGTHYTFKVKISNTGLEVGSAEITEWLPASGQTDGDATLQ